MSKILIFGDSFAADWSTKYKEYKGWPNLLAEKFTVTNIAQAGVSEFKIYKQIMSVDIDTFDTFIVSHTSPFRIPVRKHPIHSNDTLHHNADLIYDDIEFHSSKLKNILNISLRTSINFYNYLYDEEFYLTTYNMFRDKINNILANKKVICLNYLHNRYNSDTDVCLDFSNLYPNYKGTVNHLSEEGNKIIYDTILNCI